MANVVGTSELWHLCYHCLLGNMSAVRQCLDNGLVGRFPMKDLLLVQCIANHRVDVLKLLLQNIDQEFHTLKQSTVKEISFSCEKKN
jgi:hypothetical protein